MIQKMISSLLASLGRGQAQNMLPDGSVQHTRETRDGTEGPASDDSDDDSHSTSDSDSACDASDLRAGGSGSGQQRSMQRCKWTPEEEGLLRQLKNVGKVLDLQIVRKLNRSESGVRQHWCIMLQEERRKD